MHTIEGLVGALRLEEIGPDRYRAGNVDFIRKPLDANVVRGKVEIFVQLQRQRAQIERLTIQLRETEARAQRALRMLAKRGGIPEVDRR
jgi:FixJ family two-component response regulator